MEREGVVEVGEGNAILRAYRLTNDNLVDVIKLIPVFITGWVCVCMCVYWELPSNQSCFL